MSTTQCIIATVACGWLFVAILAYALCTMAAET